MRMPESIRFLHLWRCLTIASVNQNHEINEEIIPRETYADITFNDGDCVEVVSFMGGGAL